MHIQFIYVYQYYVFVNIQNAQLLTNKSLAHLLYIVYSIIHTYIQYIFSSMLQQQFDKQTKPS